MNISTEKGTKSDDDEIIRYNKLPITMIDIGKILLKIWENEDKLYPPPKFKGARFLKEFIDDLFEKREMTDNILRKYKLGKYKK